MATPADIRRRFQFVERRKRHRRMPKPLALRKYERSHTARILSLIAPYQELVRTELFPLLDVIVSESRVRVDEQHDIMGRVFENIRARFSFGFTDASIDRASQDTAMAIDNGGQEVFRQQFKTVFNADPIAAEPWLESEVNSFVAENASLIKTLPAESLSDIEQMVFRDSKRALSPQQIRKNILEQFDVTEARAQLIARDQVSKFNGRLTELRQKQSGITRYTWQTSEDGRVRSLSNSGGSSDHASLNGQIFSWDDPPVTIFKGKRTGDRHHPGEDIQCLPGRSQVKVVSGTKKLYRRRYTGELTTLVTSTGESLSVTPNHPILTTNGWKPVDSINLGDHIFKYCQQFRKSFECDVNDMDTSIETIFDTLSDWLQLVRVSGGTPQFHGDGTNQEVEIINTVRTLPDEFYSERGQEICKLILANADQTLPDSFLIGVGSLEPALKTLFCAAYSIVRGLCKLLFLHNGQFSHSQDVRLTAGAWFDSALKEMGSESASTYSKLFSSSHLAHTVDVIGDSGINIKLFSIMSWASNSIVSGDTPSAERLAEIVGTNSKTNSDCGERISFLNKPLRVVDKFRSENSSDHVYNLETNCGWYYAENILIKNCRCHAIPVLDDLL